MDHQLAIIMLLVVEVVVVALPLVVMVVQDHQVREVLSLELEMAG
tara:strand:- start:140 stop:274 length:135 start_codon:yes stop_codon:yes gene_type:complete